MLIFVVEFPVAAVRSSGYASGFKFLRVLFRTLFILYGDTRSTDWPSIQTEKLSRKFSVEFLWRGGYDEALYANFINIESSTPAISFIPDGDYYIFITKDLQNVWFGHPWEKSVTLIGEGLILAATRNGLPIG